MAKLQGLYTSARTGNSTKDEWRTPLWLYKALDREFGPFTLDPASTDENSLCDSYYTKEEDGLKQEWDGSVYVNPPYSQMRQWTQKGYEEALKGNTDVVVMLIAARTDTRAWWDYVRKGQVRFLKGRLKFEIPPEMIEKQKLEAAQRALEGKASKIFEATSAPFPSAVVIFHRYIGESSTMYWEIKEEKK